MGTPEAGGGLVIVFTSVIAVLLKTSLLLNHPKGPTQNSDTDD